jgi:hypothetical protein
MEYQIEDAERRWVGWHGFVNGQTTKRDSKLRWKGWEVELFTKPA